MVDRCPFCGGPTDVPILFPRQRQKIFCFIWENPGCTALEILQCIGTRSRATLSTSISGIRTYLSQSTPYRLVWTHGLDQRHRYKIVNAKPLVEPKEGTVNGNV